jgi:hypothetical protein
MKIAVEMGSGAYTPNVIKIGSAIKKLMGGYTDTQSTWTSDKPTLIFFSE